MPGPTTRRLPMDGELVVVELDRAATAARDFGLDE
jgi:hypothetical protein